MYVPGEYHEASLLRDKGVAGEKKKAGWGFLSREPEGNKTLVRGPFVRSAHARPRPCREFLGAATRT